MNRILLALALFFVTIFPVLAANDNWHWVMVTPQDNHIPVTWNVSQGIAKNVTFDGSIFTADMYGQDLTAHPNAGPDIRLKGTISNGEITASAVYIGTDANPEPFHGNIQKLHLMGDAQWETDRIILNGKWANGFIGITRLMKSN